MNGCIPPSRRRNRISETVWAAPIEFQSWVAVKNSRHSPILHFPAWFHSLPKFAALPTERLGQGGSGRRGVVAPGSSVFALSPLCNGSPKLAPPKKIGADVDLGGLLTIRPEIRRQQATCVSTETFLDFRMPPNVRYNHALSYNYGRPIQGQS